MAEQIRNWLIAATSAVAVFFLLGYIIVESFIYAVDFQGMFWFSDAFYARAGGRLILDLTRSLLFHPILALTSGLVSWALIKFLAGLSLRIGTFAGQIFPRCRTIDWNEIGYASAGILLSIALLNYDPPFKAWLSLEQLKANLDIRGVANGLFLLESVPAYHRLLPKPAVWIYVAVFFPFVLLLGWVFTRRMFRSRAPRAETPGDVLSDSPSASDTNTAARSGAGLGLWAVFFIYAILFVFGYGHHVYDWRISQVEMPIIEGDMDVGQSQTEQFSSTMSEDPNGESGFAHQIFPSKSSAYLVARLADAYFFLVVESELDVGRLVSYREDQVGSITFRLDPVFSLRQVRDRSPGDVR